MNNETGGLPTAVIPIMGGIADKDADVFAKVSRGRTGTRE